MQRPEELPRRARRKSSCYGIDADYVHIDNQGPKVTEEQKLLEKHSFITKYLYYLALDTYGI